MFLATIVLDLLDASSSAPSSSSFSYEPVYVSTSQQMRAQLDRPTRSHTFPKDLRQQQEEAIQKAKQAEETRQKYAIDLIGEANPFIVS